MNALAAVNRSVTRRLLPLVIATVCLMVTAGDSSAADPIVRSIDSPWSVSFRTGEDWERLPQDERDRSAGRVRWRHAGDDLTLTLEATTVPELPLTESSGGLPHFLSAAAGGLSHLWQGEPLPTELDGISAQTCEVTGILEDEAESVSPGIRYRIGTFFRLRNIFCSLTVDGPLERSHSARVALREHRRHFRLVKARNPGNLPPRSTALNASPRSATDWKPVLEGPDGDLTVFRSPRLLEEAGACAGARGRSGELYLVFAFSLTGESPDRRALAAALTAVAGIRYDDVRASESTVRVKGRSWRQFATSDAASRTAGRTVVLRIHHTGDLACLVSAAFPAGTAPEEYKPRLDAFVARLLLNRHDPPVPFQFSHLDRWQHSGLFVRMSADCARRGHGDIARRYCRIATQLTPGSTEAVESLLTLLTQQGRYAEALNLLNRPPTAIAASGFWQSERASMFALVGRMEDSFQVFEQLFARGFRNDQAFETYLASLARAGRLDEALRATERYLAAGPSRSISLVHCRLLLVSGLGEAAIAEAEQLRSTAAADPEVSCLLIEAYRDTGNFEAAETELQTVMQSGRDDVKFWFLKATVEIEQNQLTAAQRSLETALQRQPNHPQVRETLKLVTGLLGQSDATAVMAELEPVPLPDGIEPANEATSQPGSSAWYSLAAVACSVDASQRFRRTSYAIVHLEDSAAVTEFSTLEFPFQPLAERIFVNRVDVYSREGRLLAQGSIGDYYVRSDACGTLATGQQVLHVPVPGLEAGCRLEYVVTSERLAPCDSFPFLQHCFSRRHPVGTSVLHIASPADPLMMDGPPPAVESDGGRTWVFRQPPVLTDEPLPVDRRKACTVVTATGGRRTWQQIAGDYLARLSNRLAVSPEVRELSRRIVAEAEASSQEEVVTALLDFVQTGITYQGLEFGMRGQIMPPVEQTLQRRYGDCKDHSLLLYQLLRAAGVPASLCLVATDGDIARAVPAIEQFNHMIVHVDARQADWFLDATAKGSSPEFRVPVGLARKTALILDPGAPRLSQIPDYPENSSQLYSDRRIRIDADGHATVSETVQLTGYSAALYRSVMRDMYPAERNVFVGEHLLPVGSRAKSQSGAAENLDRHDRPLILRATCRVENLLHPAYGQMVGRLPGFLESNILQTDDVPARQTPFQLSYPTDVIIRTRIQFPPEYAPRGYPEDVGTSSAFGGIASRVNVRDGHLEILTRMTCRSGEYAADQWNAYAAFAELADETFSPRLLFLEAPVRQASSRTAPGSAGR